MLFHTRNSFNKIQPLIFNYMYGPRTFVLDETGISSAQAINLKLPPPIKKLHEVDAQLDIFLILRTNFPLGGIQKVRTAKFRDF